MGAFHYIFCMLFYWWKDGRFSQDILRVILLMKGWGGCQKIFCMLFYWCLKIFNWWKGGTLSENIVQGLLLKEGLRAFTWYFESYFTDGRMGVGGGDLLACTTWFHQSQVYQPICTNLTCTKLICTKPHFYHPPKMVARTRESSPSRATRSQGRSLMIFASGKNNFGLFSIVPGPVIDWRSGTDEVW